jgi:hypothetical protein
MALLERLKGSFSCDLRSLAALRMALSLLILTDIVLRLQDFSIFYTDDGPWPLAAALKNAGPAWSLYFLSQLSMLPAILFGCTAIAAIALGMGWKTRFSNIACWVLVLSLHNRNGILLNGGDWILRLMLFWSMFLPLGARWSLDARKTESTHLFSIGTIAIFTQVALIYVFNALYKTGPCWRETGTAIEETLRLETYATPLGSMLLGMPGMLRIATHGIWFVELVMPFLAFLPWRNSFFRLLVCFTFFAFHLGLFLTLKLGLFPLICMAAWLPFLPARFWDFFARKPAIHISCGSRLPSNMLCCIALVFVILLNVWEYITTLPAWMRSTAEFLKLNQKWALFAPHPLTYEGWTIVVLECSDGEEYDALTGALVDWARPAHLGSTFRSVHQRRLEWGIRTSHRTKWYAQWLVHKWEAEHSDIKVQRVRVHFLWERTNDRKPIPNNWLVYEEPPGPLSEEVKRLTKSAEPPLEQTDH